MNFNLDRLNLIARVHRWTYERLALHMQIPTERIRGIMSGKIFPKYEEMKHICRLLEVDICEIEITEFVP